MHALDDIFARLAASPFRRRFHLAGKERHYLADKGRDLVLDHARGFIALRLAPAAPLNDGRQTPMRGHPVFIAQHATATCCRGCLAKWHGIPAGRALSGPEQAHILAAIAHWLDAELLRDVPARHRATSQRTRRQPRTLDDGSTHPAAAPTQADLFDRHPSGIRTRRGN